MRRENRAFENMFKKITRDLNTDYSTYRNAERHSVLSNVD